MTKEQLEEGCRINYNIGQLEKELENINNLDPDRSMRLDGASGVGNSCKVIILDSLKPIIIEMLGGRLKAQLEDLEKELAAL